MHFYAYFGLNFCLKRVFKWLQKVFYSTIKACAPGRVPPLAPLLRLWLPLPLNGNRRLLDSKPKRSLHCLVSRRNFSKSRFRRTEFSVSSRYLKVSENGHVSAVFFISPMDYFSIKMFQKQSRFNDTLLCTISDFMTHNGGKVTMNILITILFRLFRFAQANIFKCKSGKKRSFL